MRSIAVRLLVDLTRYHPALLRGAEGRTTERNGLWSRANDRFVPVVFPGAGTVDVLWASLEIIDATYLAEMAARHTEKIDALRTARNVVKVLGPRGGFKYLSYEYTDKSGVICHVGTTFRTEGDELIALLKGYGIAVEERKQ